MVGMVSEQHQDPAGNQITDAITRLRSCRYGNRGRLDSRSRPNQRTISQEIPRQKISPKLEVRWGVNSIRTGVVVTLAICAAAAIEFALKPEPT